MIQVAFQRPTSETVLRLCGTVPAVGDFVTLPGDRATYEVMARVVEYRDMPGPAEIWTVGLRDLRDVGKVAEGSGAG